MKKAASELTAEEAALYCAVHDGAPGDVAFYLRACEGAASVLELGAGDARVAVELARAGHEVTALERDPGMRARAETRRAAEPTEVRERLTIVDADMRDFHFDARFDRVVIPFTGIYCLLSEADLDACLARVRAHLAPGGRLVFDAYAADAFHRESRPEDYPEDRHEHVATLDIDGEMIAALERSRWDRPTQRMDATYVYLDEEGAIRAEIGIGHRYLLSTQVEPALARAGLTLDVMHGDFEGAPFGPESGSMIVFASAASTDRER